jgi:hypothetical protein
MKKSTTETSSEIPDVRPSNPSRRLKELIVPTIKINSRIDAGIIDNSTPKKYS